MSVPIRLNIDEHGLPRDYATYVWLLYQKVVEDRSPLRLAFLHGPDSYDPDDPGPLGTCVMYR